MTADDPALRTGAAFWPLAAGLLTSYPRLDRDERCDVAVVGAGVTGALAAHLLSADGCDVVVVDRQDVGLGSTAASTGLLMYETDTELAELAASVGLERAVASWARGRAAIDALERVCAGTSPETRCGFVRRPSLYLATSRAEAKRLAAECALRRRVGFDAEWLERTELRRRGVAAHGGIWSRGDAEVDPYRLTHRLLQRTTAAGGRVYDRTAIERITTSTRGARLQSERGPRIDAARVVVATGYEADHDITPRRGQRQSTWALVSEPLADLDGWPERALIWEARRPYSYLRTTADQRVVIGGDDEPWSWRHRSRRRLAAKAARLQRRVSRILPDIRIEVAYAWAGTFATSRDGLPFIGTHRDHPHTWFALGSGGHGITFAMLAAQGARAWWRGAPDDALFGFQRER